MSEIIKVYKQSVPAMKFIGRKYSDEDRVSCGFGTKWGEWFRNGWFNVIEQQASTSLKETYEDGDAYIGLMRWKDGEPFAYWIGVFMPENTLVPDGFVSIDFSKKELGVCYVYGKEGEVYCKESLCAEKLAKEGYRIIPDGEGAQWFFERYVCPRFTTPDDQGNIILDICHYIE